MGGHYKNAYDWWGERGSKVDVAGEEREWGRRNVGGIERRWGDSWQQGRREPADREVKEEEEGDWELVAEGICGGDRAEVEDPWGYGEEALEEHHQRIRERKQQVAILVSSRKWGRAC